MTALFLLLSAAPSAASDPVAPPPSCERPAGNEIVVCGPRPGESPYRMPKIAKDYRKPPLRAETQLAQGVSADAHVESRALPDGNVGKALMMTIKLKF